ncbi:MAG: phosphatidylglycerophosphatase A [Candidatus Omnitrophica bacterium]|nr:phosphatidylglycerophosphatase A [Candidatus Omnitrophota bacterium]
MINRIAHWIATCGPVGHFKFAPGTFGSVIGLIFVLTINHHPAVFAVFLFVFLSAGIWSSSVVSHTSGIHDPAHVVIDEVCGILMSFWGIPIGYWTVLLGFIGFRFFDILKPPPIRWFERFPGGYGIVLDDVAAGIYTNLILQVLIRYAHL